MRRLYQWNDLTVTRLALARNRSGKVGHHIQQNDALPRTFDDGTLVDGQRDLESPQARSSNGPPH